VYISHKILTHLPQISIEVRQVRVLQTHAGDVVNEPLKGIVPGYEIRLAIQLDHGAPVSADEHSNQTMGSGSICDLGGLGPAEGLGLLVQPLFSLQERDDGKVS